MYVDPADLEGQQLTLKPVGAADYSVHIFEYTAGRIMLRPAPGNRVVWLWTITGPYMPAHLQPSHGEAETLKEAKIAFRAKFDSWLAWAKELQHPVAWTGGGTRAPSAQ